MTVPALLLSILGAVDLDELLADARALSDGATEEEEIAIVAHLLDAAIPEELVPMLDAIAEPVYLEAARRIVALGHRRANRKQTTLRRVKAPAVVQALVSNTYSPG